MNRHRLPALFTALLLSLCAPLVAGSNVTIYPAPDKSLLSTDFTMQLDGKDVPVYLAKVAPADAAGRTSAMDDKLNTANYFEKAAFAYFDLGGPVTVTVSYAVPVRSARVLPANAGVAAAIKAGKVQFTISRPGNLTLEVNGDTVRSLHIFANPVETDAPQPHAANVLYLAPGSHTAGQLNAPAGKTVIYFAPGMHTIESFVVHDGQTLYIAGGAVVRPVIAAAEPFSNIKASRGNVELKLYKQPAISLSGSNVKLRGRGIIDSSLTRGKYPLRIQGQDISLEGVILQDAGTWSMPMWYSDHVSVTNLKLINYRANSDGMDIVSSRDVNVENCFIRTLDDVITLKSIAKDPNTRAEGDTVRRVTVQNNVFWSEVAHALTIGTQVEANINTITFSNNDIIHSLGRTDELSVDLSGSGEVGNVRFENIRIDASGNPYDKNGVNPLIALMITKSATWQRAGDLARPLGKMRGVLFSNVAVTSKTASKVQIRLLGADDTSNIQDVKFEHVTFNGQPLSRSNTVVVQKFANQVSGLP